jgi:hypothetical protein
VTEGSLFDVWLVTVTEGSLLGRVFSWRWAWTGLPLYFSVHDNVAGGERGGFGCAVLGQVVLAKHRSAARSMI